MLKHSVKDEQTIALLRPLSGHLDYLKIVATTRVGGTSKLPYESLNLAHHVGDAPEQVEKNRARLRNALQLDQEIIWLNQIHGAKIVNSQVASQQICDADGVVCRVSDVPCAIMTADCLPLVIGDRSTQHFVCLHVGWRGLAQDIIERGIERLGDNPQFMAAWAGPCIGPKHFELGPEVRAQLKGPSDVWSAPKSSGHAHLDFVKLVEHRLNQAGVQYFESARDCTYSGSEQFFSYRRDATTGRQAMVVWRD